MSGLSWWDKVLLASMLRGTACPVCNRVFTCGQDVDEWQPILNEYDQPVCRNCQNALDGGTFKDPEVQKCIIRCLDFGVRTEEEQFLLNLQVLVEGGEKIPPVALGRLLAIYQRQEQYL